MKRKKKYQRGVDMKNITQVVVALIVALALTSCSDMDNSETLASKAQNSYYVEYLMCDFGPDASPEAMGTMISEWNETIDTLETAVPYSVGLVPQFETDLMGMLWVLVWPSEEMSVTGWKEWAEGPADAWAEKVKPVIDCGSVNDDSVRSYAFDVYSFWTPKAVDQEPPSVAGFSYCSYTPAITEQVLLTNLDAYNGWLDLVTEGVDQPSAYFYNVHVPRFETPIEGSQAGAYDYVYLHSWESEEARQQGSALFESSGSANADNPCTEVFLYDSYPFRNNL